MQNNASQRLANETHRIIDAREQDFGAEPAQNQIFASERPGIFHPIDGSKVDFDFTSAKNAIANRQKGGSNEDPSVIPTLPKN